MSSRPVWLVLADPLSTRVLVESGVVDLLADELGRRLQPVFLMPRAVASEWAARLPPGTRAPLHHDDLFPREVPPLERARRRVDIWLDRRFGYYPLAIRLNYRHGFHRERMLRGHRNELLDSSRVGPLPRHPTIDRILDRWHFSSRRYLPSALLRRLRAERPTLVLSNLQMQSAVPFLVAGRRIRLPLVGSVASWDHTVGKGVISTGLDRYLVQNERMREDLVLYHGVERSRIVVTGWPQSDVFHRPRPRSDFDAVLAGYGLDPTRPLVLVAGNTPTNTPDEDRFIARLAAWARETGSTSRLAFLFRPHPRDAVWRERFAAARGVEGMAVQEPSFTDLETLAVLLQHCACVVANAGTILLDALVNDRPAVCVVYDEGGDDPASSWAAKSVVGEHYVDVERSGAFYRAESFTEVIAGIERALVDPDELATQRHGVVELVVGPVDGGAARRVAAAIVESTRAPISAGGSDA